MSNNVTYELDIRFPDQSPHRVNIDGKLSLGSSDKSELCIEDYNLSPLHLSFRTHNGVLSLHNLGGQNKTILGSQELIHGKMYILNVGDELKLGDIEIFIREGEEKEETPDELKELFEEKTDPVLTSPQEELIDTREFEELEEAQELESTTDESDSMNFQSLDELAEDEEDEYEESYEEQESGTLIQKLTNIFKIRKIDVEKDIIANNKNRSIPVVPPGFFVRLFSFLSLLAMSYSIVDQIFPIFEVNSLIEPYILELQKAISAIPYSNILSSQVIKVVAVYIAIEFITTLLLGVNIAYFLFGVRNDNGIFVSRFKGIIRSLLGIITTPLVVFDIPCIIKKKTLKEALSGSRLHSPSRVKQSLGIMILFPILLLSPLYTPVLLNLEKFQPREIFEQKVVEFSKKEELINRKWSSANFNIHFDKEISKNLLVLPTVKMKKNEIQTAIKFMSKKDLNSWATISYEGKNDLISKLAPLIVLNPMFAIHYPDLESELESNKEIQTFSVGAFKQLTALIRNSLNLDPLNIKEVFMGHGPFVQDLMALNQLVLESLSVSDATSLSFFSNKDKILVSNTIQSKNSVRTEYLVILKSGVSLSYRSIASKKYSRLTSRMIEHFFQNTTAYTRIKHIDIFNWATTIDLLTSIIETKKDLTESELAKSYEYYFEFTRNYLKTLLDQDEDERAAIKELLVSELTNTQEFLESTLEFNNFSKVSELNGSLERLKENFKEENLNFFSINK